MQGRRILCLGTLMCLLAGCQEHEPISQNRWPRVALMQRFLGAMIPAGDTVWFVKLVGPEVEIAKQTSNFDAFLRSLNLAEKARLTWKLPTGWEEKTDAAKEGRFATIWIASGKKNLELTVTSLDAAAPQASSVEENINRWRRQIGLAMLDRDKPGEFEDYYREMRLAGLDAFVIDMIGPGAKTREPDRDPPPAPFEYKKPAGWKVAPPVQFSMLTFEIRDGDKRAVFTLSRVAGSLLDNLNRWYGQVGLKELSEKELANLPDVAIAGAKAKLVDITGDGAPPERNRILGAILADQAGGNWFFKMIGPSELVGRQRAGFDAFLQSFSFKK